MISLLGRTDKEHSLYLTLLVYFGGTRTVCEILKVTLDSSIIRRRDYNELGSVLNRMSENL